TRSKRDWSSDVCSSDLPTIEQGQVLLRLIRFRAMGMPVTAFKGLVMSMFATLARKEPWVRVDEDHVRLDVDGMLAKEGLTARVRSEEHTSELQSRFDLV